MVTLTIKVSVSFANFVGKKTLTGGVAATETSETEIRKIGYELIYKNKVIIY